MAWGENEVNRWRNSGRQRINTVFSSTPNPFQPSSAWLFKKYTNPGYRKEERRKGGKETKGASEEGISKREEREVKENESIILQTRVKNKTYPWKDENVDEASVLVWINWIMEEQIWMSFSPTKKSWERSWIKSGIKQRTTEVEVGKELFPERVKEKELPAEICSFGQHTKMPFHDGSIVSVHASSVSTSCNTHTSEYCSTKELITFTRISKSWWKEKDCWMDWIHVESHVIDWQSSTRHSGWVEEDKRKSERRTLSRAEEE